MYTQYDAVTRHMCFELMGGRLASAPAMLLEVSRNNPGVGKERGDDAE